LRKTSAIKVKCICDLRCIVWKETIFTPVASSSSILHTTLLHPRDIPTSDHSTMRIATASALAVAMASSLVSAYPITGTTVNCRAEPNTSSAVKKTYAKGVDVKLVCQTEGPVIEGNSIWDKTTDGCYVADFYVKTGKNGYVTDKCSGGGTPKPPSGGFCKGLNAGGIEFVKAHEGFVAKPSPDPVGLPTVGYGHLCKKKGCAEVKYKFPLTKATASQLLNDDIPNYTGCLGKALNSGKVKLNDNQWAALTSWTFNVGCNNMLSPTLLKRLNKGDNPNTVASEELPKWRLGQGGKVLPGLVRRRKEEVALFKKASSKSAFPKCQ